MSKALTEKQVEKRFSSLSSWMLNKKKTELSREFKFPSFVTGLAFVAKIAVHSEILNHHPDILLSYGTVRVTLTTHDAGGLTVADFELAMRIDKLQTVS
jgi:4a-hydroxytetrahydrobiopterin dehydratase